MTNEPLLPINRQEVADLLFSNLEAKIPSNRVWLIVDLLVNKFGQSKKPTERIVEANKTISESDLIIILARHANDEGLPRHKFNQVMKDLKEYMGERKVVSVEEIEKLVENYCDGPYPVSKDGTDANGKTYRDFAQAIHALINNPPEEKI